MNVGKCGGYKPPHPHYVNSQGVGVTGLIVRGNRAREAILQKTPHEKRKID